MITLTNNNDGTTSISNFSSDKTIIALIDTEDLERMLNHSKSWYYNKQRKYVFTTKTVNNKSKTTDLHRLINQTPPHLETDHINGITTDNRKSNLRSVTHKENMNNTYKHRDPHFMSKKNKPKRTPKYIYIWNNNQTNQQYYMINYNHQIKYRKTLEEATRCLESLKQNKNKDII